MPEDIYICKVCSNKLKVQSFAITDKTVPTCHQRPMVPAGFATDFGFARAGAAGVPAVDGEAEQIAEKTLLGPKPKWLEDMLQSEAGIGE